MTSRPAPRRRAAALAHRLDRSLPLVVKVGTPVMAVSIGMALYLEGSVGRGACAAAACQHVASQVGLVATDGTALLLVVLWLVFVLFVGRRARRLADVARRVADGDLTARVAVAAAAGRSGEAPRDELLVVSAQFDRMLDTLVDEQRRLQQLTDELAHQAHHDALTGLGNRALLLARLRAALDDPRGPFALLLVDLDDFRTVNDSLGQDVGDLLLTTTAARLTGCVRPEETVVRLVGDVFAVFSPSVAEPAAAVALARRALAALAAPLQVEGATIVPRGRAGVLVHDPAGAAPARAEDVLGDADLAVAQAGRAPVEQAEAGRVALFSPPLRAEVVARQQATTELRAALPAGELEVHYQPYARLSDPTTACGSEALVRWRHPARGLVPPGDFIPLAESTGLIRPIGLWVLQRAATTAAAWQREQPHAPLTASVNLAPQQLLDSALTARVAEVLATTGLAPSSLVLELTETALMLDLADAAARLADLRSLGVRIAIDDFGTGSSSLSYLHALPVDVVKVDQAFVARLERDAPALAMVRAVVDIASSLGLRTVAEGVETPQQLAILGELGCDLAQGFLLSRPVPERAARPLMTGRARLGPPMPRPATAPR